MKALLFSEAERWANIRQNLREFESGNTRLGSTPRLVTLGAHNSCNAQCIFCLEGKYERFTLKLYRDFFENRMGHFIRQAEKVTFTGFGEILWIPGVEEFLGYLNETIPETEKIFTTNGTPLKPRVVELLLQSRYVIQVSLHASHAALHEKLTLLKDFPQILANLEGLSRLRRERGLAGRLHLMLVNVVTTENIEDLPDFLRLAWRLQVPEVRCHYVTMYNADHIRLSCFFDQERTNRCIRKAQSALEEMRALSRPEESAHFQAHLPPLFGEFPRVPAPSPMPPSSPVCPDPWQHVYVEGQGSVLPCCYWGEHVGNLNKGEELGEIWNGPFYQGLRQGMASGRPHPWCSVCVKYQGYNVDNLLCHITNRPNQQRVLLEEIQRRSLLDVSPYREWAQRASSYAPI